MHPATFHDYVKAADGTFGSGWKTVTFDEVKNVTDVKIQPTSTSGDVANKFSSAAEVRIMGAEEAEVPEEKNTYRVTVTGGTIAGGTTAGDYEYNTKLTVTADGTTDGQKFLGWEVNGNVLSTEEVYTFFVGSDLTVRALYGAEAIQMEAQAYLQDVKVTKRDDGRYDIRYLAQLTVPEGYTLKEAGLVWSNKGIDSEADLIYDNAGTMAGVKVTKISRISNTMQFSVTIKGVPEGTNVPGRVFAKFAQQEEVVHSAILTAETK